MKGTLEVEGRGKGRVRLVM